jgi:hypothetical protein
MSAERRREELGPERYLDMLRAEPLREKAMLELTRHALRPPGLHELAQGQSDAVARQAVAA